ncbi:MAG TPA: hypothetical protein VGP94_09810 [Tepidisphaeraceae bacterium]|nr:hypothetical protein [Tepidisphaeraceae bacterium]
MTHDEHRHMGHWRVPKAVGVLLILLFIAASAWGIWRWMQKSQVNADAVAVDPPARGPARGPARRAAGEPPGRIFKRDDGSIRAFSGNFWLTIAPPNREPALHCGNGEEWLNKDQQLLLKMAQRWSRGSNTLRGIEFTPEQKDQMKLVSAEPTLPLSPQDRTKLEGLIKAWEEAKDPAKPDAQRAVLLALREVAKANLPAGKDAFVASVNKLNSMLTPQQLDQYRQIEMARRNGNRPTPPANTGRGA